MPFTSAIDSLVGPAAGPSPLAGVVDYVGACETQGHGDAALRLLARLKISRRQGRMSLSTIGVEVLLLVLVLAIHGIFVLPQFKAVFAAAGAPLPAFTRVVLALIGPTGPFLYLAIFVLLAVLACASCPYFSGPCFDRSIACCCPCLCSVLCCASATPTVFPAGSDSPRPTRHRNARRSKRRGPGLAEDYFRVNAQRCSALPIQARS